MTGLVALTRAVLAAGLLSLPAGAGAQGTIGGAELRDFAETCRHFDNRSRFKPRSADAELVVRLAEGCHAAMAHLASGRSVALGRAYLSQLGRFRDLTVAMLTERRRTDRPLEIGAAGSAIRRIGLTATGEYLIAREMGLIGAYDDWAAATGFRVTEAR